MQAKQPRRATYADLEDTPETVIAEIIDGELVLSPRWIARHALVAAHISFAIANRFDVAEPPEGGRWLIGLLIEIRIDGDAWVPEIAGWRRESLPTPLPDYPSIPPDWVCEILSPKSRRMDRMKKMPLYARAGIPWAWLVEPEARSIEVYRAVGPTDARRW